MKQYVCKTPDGIFFMSDPCKSKEEAEHLVSIGGNIVIEEYRQIGTCEQCEHYRGWLCFLSATYNYEAPMKDSDDMCKGFERRQND